MPISSSDTGRKPCRQTNSSVGGNETPLQHQYVVSPQRSYISVSGRYAVSIDVRPTYSRYTVYMRNLPGGRVGRRENDSGVGRQAVHPCQSLRWKMRQPFIFKQVQAEGILILVYVTSPREKTSSTLTSSALTLYHESQFALVYTYTLYLPCKGGYAHSDFPISCAHSVCSVPCILYALSVLSALYLVHTQCARYPVSCARSVCSVRTCNRCHPAQAAYV